MKVLEERSAFLSDYEVLQYLTKLEIQYHWDDESLQSDSNRGKNKRIKNRRPYNNPALQGIVRDTISYLQINKNYIPQAEGDEESQKENEKSPITRMNDTSFTELMRKLNEFELFQAEKLQIVNQLPTNMAHLYSVVEECDSRFSESQISSLLSIIQEYA